MQLGYAFLARFAESGPDNTVSTIGGDFETYRARAFPSATPMAIVLKLTGVGGPEASGTPLPFVVDIIGPAGASILEEPLVGAMRPNPIPKNKSSTASGVARIVLNLGVVLLPEVGPYQVRITLGEGDGALSHALPLNAEVVNA